MAVKEVSAEIGVAYWQWPPEVRELFFREYFEVRLCGRRPNDAERVAHTLARVAMRSRPDSSFTATLGEELYAREVTDAVRG